MVMSCLVSWRRLLWHLSWVEGWLGLSATVIVVVGAFGVVGKIQTTRLLQF